MAVIVEITESLLHVFQGLVIMGLVLSEVEKVEKGSEC
jgi:hypothetical protein